MFRLRSQHACLWVTLSVCLAVSLSICLSVCKKPCQSVRLSFCLPVSLSASLPVKSLCLLVCLAVSLSVCLNVSLPACKSLCLFACQSVCCLYACLSACVWLAVRLPDGKWQVASVRRFFTLLYTWLPVNTISSCHKIINSMWNVLRLICVLYAKRGVIISYVQGRDVQISITNCVIHNCYSIVSHSRSRMRSALTVLH